MAKRSLPRKKPIKIKVPMKGSELHAAIRGVINSRTLGRAFSGLLLQTLYVYRACTPAEQVDYARALGVLADSWTVRLKGGAL